MEFDNKLPEWKNEGAEPSSTRIEKGFELGYKPPAGIFNWFWSKVSKAITELQTKFGAHAENKENPHGVTAAQVGLDKVNNTPDSEKSVKFASEAGVGQKVKNSLAIRFNGGRAEGANLFTYDGSAGKSVDITPANIGAAEKEHGHTLDDVAETTEKKFGRVVTATKGADTTVGGVACNNYSATVTGITELYNGLEITIIPDTNSTSRLINLDVNGLGAIAVRQPLSFTTFVATSPTRDGFLYGNTPCRLMYHANYAGGGIWLMADKQKTSAQDLYGTVPLESGGTGGTTVEAVRENLGFLSTQIATIEGSSFVSYEDYASLFSASYTHPVGKTVDDIFAISVMIAGSSNINASGVVATYGGGSSKIIYLHGTHITTTGNAYIISGKATISTTGMITIRVEGFNVSTGDKVNYISDSNSSLSSVEICYK